MFSLFVCHKRSVNISVFGSITGALSFEHEKRLVNKVCKVILLSRRIKAFLRMTLFTRPPQLLQSSHDSLLQTSNPVSQFPSTIPGNKPLCKSHEDQMQKFACQSHSWGCRTHMHGVVLHARVCVLLVRLSKCCERQRLHTHCNLLQSHICFV